MYALPAGKALFKVLTNSYLFNWFNYFKQTLFMKTLNTVILSFFIFANLPIAISTFKRSKVIP